MWECVVAMAAMSALASQKVEPEPELLPEPTDCAGCGAPLRIYTLQCDYCKREKENTMFNWFKRKPKETSAQQRIRLAAEQLRRVQQSSSRSYSAPSPSPAPAPAHSSFDPVSAALWYSMGSSSSHHSAPAAAPEPDRFVSGGGGDYGGGGASNSWDSGSSCSSSSSDYSSSSSDCGSSSSSYGGSD